MLRLAYHPATRLGHSLPLIIWLCLSLWPSWPGPRQSFICPTPYCDVLRSENCPGRSLLCPCYPTALLCRSLPHWVGGNHSIARRPCSQQRPDTTAGADAWKSHGAGQGQSRAIRAIGCHHTERARFPSWADLRRASSSTHAARRWIACDCLTWRRRGAWLRTAHREGGYAYDVSIQYTWEDTVYCGTLSHLNRRARAAGCAWAPNELICAAWMIAVPRCCSNKCPACRVWPSILVALCPISCVIRLLLYAFVTLLSHPILWASWTSNYEPSCCGVPQDTLKYHAFSSLQSADRDRHLAWPNLFAA